MSLVISLALDFPKFITREPPPCIWFSMKKKIRMITRNGSQPNEQRPDRAALGTWTL